MTTRILKPVYIIEEIGELGRLPDGAIINAGGTSNATFTVNGRGLLFDDGTSTAPGGSGSGYTLQVAYGNSLVPAKIDLTSGKNIVFNAVNNKQFVFNADTGTVTIEGDLNVLGSTTVIEGTVSNLDQVNISMPNPTTVGLTIIPMVGVVPTSELMLVKAFNSGPVVFSIDSSGTTNVTDIVIGGTINGTPIADLLAHLDTSPLPAKHKAQQISVAPLPTILGTDVQTVLENIDAAIQAAGTGSGTVTSVAVTSTDLTVTGSPITSSGTIQLDLNTVPISKGGTGATTASDAINALLPSQAANTGKVLSTDGSNVGWIAMAGSISYATYFTNAAPTGSGLVGDKTYVLGTTPPNSILTTATSDTSNVTVTVLAESTSPYYAPTVTVTTVPAQSGGAISVALTQDAYDKKMYTGTVALTGVTTNMTVTASSSTGSSATLLLYPAGVGPAFSTFSIGALPGSQTAVKSGDIVQVNGIVPNAATYAEVLAGGASTGVSVLTLGAADSAGLGFKTVTGTFTASSLSGAQTIQGRARNSFGTYGATATSSNSVLMDQVAPTIGAFTITYPVGQQGLKNTETATISSTVTNYTSVAYTATNLSVDTPAVYAASKTVTLTGGTYSYGTNNYTITATKSSNGTSATASTAVSIANVAPTAAITIVGSPARLTSSPTGNDYTITITANQRLLSAPSLTASSGTWQGSWTGSGTTWTRVLRITDTDPKGSQLFSALQVTGLAGLIGNTITSGASYTVGGFSARNIIFPAFARYAPIGTSVTNTAKLVASYTGASTLTFYPDTADHFQGFSIVDSSGNYSATGNYLYISDAAFAGSNTSGTLSLTIQENA